MATKGEIDLSTAEAVRNLEQLKKEIAETTTTMSAMLKQLQDLNKGLVAFKGGAMDLAKIERENIKLEQQLVNERQKLANTEIRYKKELASLAQKQQQAILAQSKVETEASRKKKIDLDTEIKQKRELERVDKQRLSDTKGWFSALGSYQFKFNMLGNVVANAIGNLASWFSNLGIQMYEQTKRISSLNMSFKAIFPTTEEYNKAIQSLSKTADAHGVSILELKEQYLSFAAASKGTSLEGKASLDIFNSVAKSLSVMGVSGQQSERAFLALSQMMSKGTVQSEELKRQLGDALPGAFKIMADAMGVPVAKLQKMMEQGEVLAEVALPKFAKQLELAYGAGSVTRINTLAAAEGRYQTQITRFIDGLQAGGFFTWWVNLKASMVGFFADLANPIGEAEKGVKSVMIELSKAQSDINNSNIPLEQRKQIYKQLQDQYPAYLGNLSFEKQNYSEINKVLNKLNNDMIIRLILAKKEDEIQKQRTSYGESALKSTEKEIEARKYLNDLQVNYNKKAVEERKYMTIQNVKANEENTISIDRTRNVYGQLEQAVSEYYETEKKYFRRKQPEDVVNRQRDLYKTVLLFGQLKSAYADTRKEVNLLDDLNAQSKEIRDQLNATMFNENDLLKEQLSKKQQTIKNADLEISKLDDLIEKNKEYKDIVVELEKRKKELQGDSKGLKAGDEKDPMLQQVDNTNKAIEANKKYILSLGKLKDLAKEKLKDDKEAKEIEKENEERQKSFNEKTKEYIELQKIEINRISEKIAKGEVLSAQEEEYYNNLIQSLKEYIETSDKEMLKDSEKINLIEKIDKLYSNSYKKRSELIEENYIKELEYNEEITKRQTDVLEKYLKDEKELAKARADNFSELSTLAIDFFSLYDTYMDLQISKQNNAKDNELSLSQRNYENNIKNGMDEVKAKATYEAEKNSIDIKYQNKIAQIEHDQAKYRLLLETAEVFSKQALAIMNAYAVGESEEEINRMITAASVAASIAYAKITLTAKMIPPVPQYWAGTDDHKGGLALVNDRGLGNEMVIEPSGKKYIVGGENVLIDMPKHSKVIPNKDIAKELSKEKENANTLNNELLEELISTVANKKEVAVNITEQGFAIFTRKNNTRLQFVNNRYRS